MFKAPRDVLQIKTLGQQLGLGAQLNEWFQDATSNRYGHSVIDLIPKTIDTLRYCTVQLHKNFNYQREQKKFGR